MGFSQKRWVCSRQAGLSIALALALSSPSGDPAGPAQAAQHGSPVPAADVRGTAAAPHAADGGASAATPRQRPAPEPGSCAAGKNSKNAAGATQSRNRCKVRGEEAGLAQVHAMHPLTGSSQNPVKWV